MRRHLKISFFACAVWIVVILFCDHNPQGPRSSGYSLKIEADSSVALRDTLRFSVVTENAGAGPTRYFLLREGSWDIDTFLTPEHSTRWFFPDTGKQRFIVWAEGPGDRRSAEDTVTVFVRCFAPSAKVSGDTIIFVNETARLSIETADQDGRVERCEWFIDDSVRYVSSGPGGVPALRWGIDDTGRHTIRAAAIDDDGLRSGFDTIIILVSASVPVPELSGDTAIGVNDTARFFCRSGEEWDSARSIQSRFCIHVS